MTEAPRPAILGGAPVRPHGPPGWPPDDEAVREILAHLARTGEWGRYHGPWCEGVADALRELQPCRHAILCSSGTVAVELALRGLEVGPGDEVILAAYDFKGNFQDVLAVGAVPVLVDVRQDDLQFDASRLSAAVGPRTKAILVSHLHGGVVDLPEIVEFARANGLSVVEDACQMPGARVHGRAAGSHGDVGVHSFGGSKLLTAGRGGAVVTDRADVAQRIRLFKERGNDAYPLSEMQAAVLVPQLDRLTERNRRRAESVDELRRGLAQRAGLEPFPAGGDDAQPGFYKLGFQYDAEAFDGLSRASFCRALRAEGIAMDPGFRALHRIHSRRRYRAVGALPVASDADERVVVLHHPILLEGREAMAEIVEAVDRVRAGARMIRDQLDEAASASDT